MAPAWINRGRGGGIAGYYYSLVLRKFALSRHFSIDDNTDLLVRAFSTSRNTSSNLDDIFLCHANNYNPATKSSSPPHPIPNRPLRTDSGGNRSRRAPSNPQFTKSVRHGNSNNPNRDTGGADFLERFKLRFANKDKDDDKVNSNPADVAEPKAAGAGAAELEPIPPPQDADEIFRKMKETGLIPNAVAMLDGLCKDGLVQEAMKLFSLMREKGTIPEVVIYTAVVEGFCKAHRFNDAVRIFRKMLSNNVVPNAFSYGLLIQGLCKGKRLDDAVEFSVEALEAGHPLNLSTFTGLVDGFCREKGLEDAKNLISTLRQKGYFFDEKAVREYLEKKGPFSPIVWEAIIGKKAAQRSSLFD